MLKPSIDTLLDKVNSKYSLVILSSKRAHEIEEGAYPTKEEFKSVKPVLKALEEIEEGKVIVHPNPEEKRAYARMEEERRQREFEEEQEKLQKQVQEEQGNI
jgi:DNA-directed RNA polymerase subunit omega